LLEESWCSFSTRWEIETIVTTVDPVKPIIYVISPTK
jgi:hypothetical protein